MQLQALDGLVLREDVVRLSAVFVLELEPRGSGSDTDACEERTGADEEESALAGEAPS